MNKPVLQILGAMLVHDDFHDEMVADPHTALAARGYVLTPEQMEVVLNIVKSFEEEKLDDAIDSVRAECPNWPCNDGNLAA